MPDSSYTRHQYAKEAVINAVVKPLHRNGSHFRYCLAVACHTIAGETKKQTVLSLSFYLYWHERYARERVQLDDVLSFLSLARLAQGSFSASNPHSKIALNYMAYFSYGRL